MYGFRFTSIATAIVIAGAASSAETQTHPPARSGLGQYFNESFGSFSKSKPVQNPRDFAFEAAAGHFEYIEKALNVPVDESTLRMAHLWAASGLNSGLMPQASAQKQRMLTLLEGKSANKNAMLNNTLEQVISSGDVDVVQYLLDRGADPNSESVILLELGVRQPRILGWAAENRAGKADEMVGLLIRHGADPALGLAYLGEGEEAAEARALVLRKAAELRGVKSPALKL